MTIHLNYVLKRYKLKQQRSISYFLMAISMFLAGQRVDAIRFLLLSGQIRLDWLTTRQITVADH